MQYLGSGYYPVQTPPDLYTTWRGKLVTGIWIEIKEKNQTKSLRGLAREYGVSHESVRRVLKATNPGSLA